MNENEKTPEFYGIDGLAKVTGYKKPTIYLKTSKNEIPYYKRDGKLVFRHSEIVQWMQQEAKTEIVNGEKKLRKKRGRVPIAIQNEHVTNLCTQSYYADLRGMSKSWVSQAMDYGKIKTVTVLGGLRLIKL